MTVLDRVEPPHRWSPRGRAGLLVATVASVLLVLVVPAGIVLSMLGDSSPSLGALIAFTLGTTVVVAIATLGLLVSYLSDVRTNPLVGGELRTIWFALLLVLGQLAMIFYWLYYLRPSAAGHAGDPRPPGATATSEARRRHRRR